MPAKIAAPERRPGASGGRKHSAAPAGTVRARGSAASTQVTRELILQQARVVLGHEGHARLTIRRVAELAGITVGNVTYHFPSKRGLLRALIDGMLEDYHRRLHGFFQEGTRSAGERFHDLMRWTLKDAVSPENNRLFRELWAMSLHDTIVAQGVADFYDDLLRDCGELLRKSRPQLDTRTALEIVHLLSLVVEGTTIIYGGGTRRAVPMKRMVERTLQILDQVAGPASA